MSGAELTPLGDGVYAAPGARIIDRSGRRRLPIGYDGFADAMRVGTLVDKTMLIADVLDSGYKATLFCRPRRFGKTLNMTMLKAFLEAPEAGGLPRADAEATFEHTEVWDAAGGAFRELQGTYPVVHLSLATATGDSWDEARAALAGLVTAEYLRHAYLRGEGTPLQPEEVAYLNRVISGTATDADLASSLASLCRMLRAYHGREVVLLIDEYDAPVMSGHSGSYYDRVVSFMRRWLTGAIKDGGAALAFACLTGVQRISKESIFSGLNSLYVSTPLGQDFDERYGFTDAEVEALATYLGHAECMPEAREWYDGYRFGRVDVYNPWSVLNYLRQGCSPGVYWGNTSGNAVVGQLVARSRPRMLGKVYALLEPGGTVDEPLDLGVVFPDLDLREDALWSVLYLSGYVTTDDVEDPSDDMLPRRLRLPDREVARLFEGEVLRRFQGEAGGREALSRLHRALVAGDEAALGEALSRVARDSASYHDLTSESSCHMLVMGLMFGVPGYRYPTSNRESGLGRYDIRLEPDPSARPRPGVPAARPLVTVEVKRLRPQAAPRDPGAIGDALAALAQEALAQVRERAYDAGLPAGASGRVRWGVAFSGKRVAVACERVPEGGGAS